MMNNWFEVKVAYTKVMENGLEKRVVEPFLVEALSFTEAEKRIIEEVRPFISGAFEVSAVGRKKYAEIIYDDSAAADKYYHTKLMFVTLDERTDVEKRTPCFMLVQAEDMRKAIESIDRAMKHTMCDYEIAEVKETAISDVYAYHAEEV